MTVPEPSERPPVHWSQLRRMAASPAHYAYYLDNPPPMTPVMRFGSLVDSLVFGTGGFVVYEGQRRGNAWKDFKEQHGGPDRIVTAAEQYKAESVVHALQAHAHANRLLWGGKSQVKTDWLVGDRACQGTPDVLNPDGLTDLKVTIANPAQFQWHARKMLWHGQMAWYANGMYGHDLPDTIRLSIVAVEPKPPYVVTVFDMTQRCLESGTRLWRSLFERLMVCEESGYFPGYTEGIALFDAEDEDVSLIIDGEEVEL